MERRVRAERGPSARERCGNDWHSPPIFMGRVNQMPIFRDVPEEASIRYGKLLTRLTGSRKARKLAIIQAFCASRDSGNDGQRRGAEAKTCSRAAPALRLSLPHRHLVNSVDGACWSDGRVGNDGILARGAAGGGRGVGVECAAGESSSPPIPKISRATLQAESSTPPESVHHGLAEKSTPSWRNASGETDGVRTSSTVTSIFAPPYTFAIRLASNTRGSSVNL